jgi:hypothetical protein
VEAREGAHSSGRLFQGQGQSDADDRLERESKADRGESRATDAQASDDVAAFVTDHFKTLLTGAGLTVVDSGENAIIKGDVQRFFVTESSKYSGEVRIAFVVTDPAGKTLWEGATGGTSVRAGFSYQAENYYESLSDALTIATDRLLREPGFEAAIARTR